MNWFQFVLGTGDACEFPAAALEAHRLVQPQFPGRAGIGGRCRRQTAESIAIFRLVSRRIPCLVYALWLH